MKKSMLNKVFAVAALSAIISPVFAYDKVDALEARVNELSSDIKQSKSGAASSSAKDNVITVRGGWAQADLPRGNWSLADATSNGLLVGGAGSNGDPMAGSKSHRDAFYVGAGFDYNVNNDLFGLWRGTSFQVELGAEYAQFGKSVNVVTGRDVTINQLRVSVSPKFKFMHGSKLRPWLIPAGMDINIVSPPTGAISYINPGMQSGGGVEYDLFNGIMVGTDVRYHYSLGNMDGVSTDGLTAGGYVGFKF